MRLNAINSAINRLFVLGGGGGPVAWSPSALYAAGQVGAWYDPSDLSTMFTDAAGTTPVVQPGTVADQPVGLITDKSPLGIDASQSTSTARPLLSARVNYMLYTEDLTNGIWQKRGAISITPNATLAPDGTSSADLISNLGTGGVDDIYQVCPELPSVTGARTGLSFYLKKVTSTGVIDVTAAQGPSFGNWQVALGGMGSGWERITEDHPAVTVVVPFVVTAPALNSGPIFSALSGGPLSLYMWGAQLELGSTATTYQRVTTASDYDGTPGKFPYYLKFDGVDDYLSTAAIDFTGTDKVTVFGGIYKGASAEQIVVELSTNTGTTQGAWYVTQPYNAASVGSSGLGPSHVSVNSVSAYSTSVFTLQAEISADFNSLRVNGVNGTDATGDQGTGNYGNWPLFIGARSGPSLPFNGNLYSLIIAGALYDAATITEAETWVAGKTGVTL